MGTPSGISHPSSITFPAWHYCFPINFLIFALLAMVFAGMKEMRLSPRMASFEAWEKVSKEAGRVYKEVQERCFHRGVQLSFDAIAWPNAYTEHVHI